MTKLKVKRKVAHTRLQGKRGRPRQWAEDMQARFPAGTFKRIERLLGEAEDRTDFVREAVEREIKRREAKGRQ